MAGKGVLFMRRHDFAADLESLNHSIFFSEDLYCLSERKAHSLARSSPALARPSGEELYKAHERGGNICAYVCVWVCP